MDLLTLRMKRQAHVASHRLDRFLVTLCVLAKDATSSFAIGPVGPYRKHI